MTASENQESDLFWALRGGGGNFAAVTSLTMDVFELPSVQTSTMFVALSSARSALLQMQHVIDDAPEESG